MFFRHEYLLILRIMRTFADDQASLTFAVCNGRRVYAGAVKTSMESLRPTKPFVGLAERERTFSKRYLSVSSNFANLNLYTAVMQLKRLRGCIISRRIIALIYIRCDAESYMYNTTRRGLACVAYPCIEAMRRPELRDRRGGTNSHVFFLFPYLKTE